ncbi:hypothetical protein INT45_006040 [Circinella minor]|uniref:Uncharacterized protein n=1 Tax=Circinella minor TaxID=1195481 RepID=A0A8H7S022_9FUNG|nr:hypothetical protein INT45_006040 [Circinella minor]
MNDETKEIIEKLLSQEHKDITSSHITHKTFDGLEPDVKVMIDEIIKVKDNQGELIYYTKEDMDKILEDISYRKIDCLKNKQRNTQKYHVLNIIERIIESFDLWSNDNKDITSGESGSLSSRTEIVLNKAIFHSNNSKPTYSRKIDLLIKTKDLKKPIELSSNEWKRASAGVEVQLNQQCNSGYFYSLKWLPEHHVYFASNPTVIHIPTEPLFLADVKSMLSALYNFKASLVANAHKALVAAKRKNQNQNIQSTITINKNSHTSLFDTTTNVIPINSVVASSPESPIPPNIQLFTEPFVFFTPQNHNHRTKKRRIAYSDHESEDDNESEEEL